MPRLSIQTLGPPHVECDGQAITVDTRKAIALLVYLAVERRAHTRDMLSGLFWPEYDQTHARATLRRTLSTLNAALPASFLRIDRETIALDEHAPVSLDTDDFHQLLRQCHEHPHGPGEVCPSCLAPLAKAAALYRDDFLAGFYLRDATRFEDWQCEQREQLRRELAGTLERLARLLIARHAFAEAIPYARRWLQLDPLHEAAHRYLMRLFAWSGQHAAALRQYRDCVRTLDRELGVAPLEATTQLYEAIKEHRAPGPPPIRPKGSSGQGSASPNAQTTTAPSESAPPQRVPTAPTSQTTIAPPAPPFVGRAHEWEVALDVYRTSAAGGRILVVKGEAGIGKTRLIEELAAHARRAGARVVATQCYEGETALAYTPVAAIVRAAIAQQPDPSWLARVPDHWLSESARLLPELAQLRPGLPVAAPLDSPGAESRFFEGLRHMLVAVCRSDPPPGLLIMDDLQWADSASLDLLAYLVRRLAADPLCLVLAWRGGEVPTEHRLQQLVADAQRAGRATLLTLGRLSPTAVSEWITSAQGQVGDSQTPEAATRLYEETEGLPFFIAEYMRALSSGALSPQAPSWAVPGGVHDLLRSRLRTISEAGWQILTAAAVLGRSFDFATVRETSGRSEEETVTALEELTARSLISEVRAGDGSGPDYDFTHGKLRALVYDETSLARRRLLHRRVAETLAAAARHQRPGGPPAGQIAQHYLAGGDEATAAEYYKLAGGQARSLYANADALRHLQLALALGHPDTQGLHEAIGDVQMLLGEYAAALASYESAAACAEAGILARLERKLGQVYVRRREWHAARSQLEAALAALGDTGAAGERAHIYADWSLIARHQGALDEAQAHAERALHLATTGDDQRALVQVHNLLGLLASDRDAWDVARQHLERSLQLAERLHDAGAQAAALNNLALALGRAGDTSRALELAEAALALCTAQGDRHHEAALHNNIADLLHNAGRGSEAIPHLKQAVAIYAEIGVEAGAVQPEIWKLSVW